MTPGETIISFSEAIFSSHLFTPFFEAIFSHHTYYVFIYTRRASLEKLHKACDFLFSFCKKIKRYFLKKHFLFHDSTFRE